MKPFKKVIARSPILVFSTLTLLGACSSNPPTEQMSVAEHSLQESAINKDSEYAPLEMRMARDHFDAAKRAMEEEEYMKARRLAEKTTADVEAANAKADFERSNNALNELVDSNQSLQQELKQKSRSGSAQGTSAETGQ